ncbi:ribose-phosphate pyrophosphokinase, partial [Candidatus Micrarchaeota archaeon]|nr:ribose-phosphate pyrophosphokinase [Candidatus Micrarchaeota archaeon]
INFDVKGMNVLIIDDMISTGGTMIRGVENVKKGGAKKILCAATHGFFLKESLGRLRAVADDVFTTNSIPNEAARIDIKTLLP